MAEVGQHLKPEVAREGRVGGRLDRASRAGEARRQHAVVTKRVIAMDR